MLKGFAGDKELPSNSHEFESYIRSSRFAQFFLSTKKKKLSLVASPLNRLSPVHLPRHKLKQAAKLCHIFLAVTTKRKREKHDDSWRGTKSKKLFSFSAWYNPCNTTGYMRYLWRPSVYYFQPNHLLWWQRYIYNIQMIFAVLISTFILDCNMPVHQRNVEIWYNESWIYKTNTAYHAFRLLRSSRNPRGRLVVPTMSCSKVQEKSGIYQYS